MFTGLVEEVGQVAAIDKRGQHARLTIKASVVQQDTSLGDSVAVNGVCLTVVEIRDSLLSFDAVAETMKRTSLGRLKTGSPVNLERAVAVGQRMGGHFVQGHVDGVATLVNTQKEGNGHVFRFEPEPQLCRYLVSKGSVAIDGISLTLVDVEASQFTVWIVPHTLAHTNLGGLLPGTQVNIETDILAKYTEKLLGKSTEVADKALKTTLQENGFLGT